MTSQNFYIISHKMPIMSENDLQLASNPLQKPKAVLKQSKCLILNQG